MEKKRKIKVKATDKNIEVLGSQSEKSCSTCECKEECKVDGGEKTPLMALVDEFISKLEGVFTEERNYPGGVILMAVEPDNFEKYSKGENQITHSKGSIMGMLSFVRIAAENSNKHLDNTPAGQSREKQMNKLSNLVAIGLTSGGGKLSLDDLLNI